MDKKNISARSLHWLCRQPTPYNDHLFQGLENEPSLELTVHYRNHILPSHPWRSTLAQGYRARFYKTIFGIDWYLLSLAMKERRAFFVIGSWDHTTSIILLVLLRLLKKPYALWTDTPNLKRKRYPFYAFLRMSFLRWIFAGAAQIMGTGELALVNLQKMGCPEALLVNFPYYIDVAKTKPIIRKISAGQPIVYASLGRLAHEKGYDLVLTALAHVFRNSGRGFCYKIAGTGSQEKALRQQALSLGIVDSVEFVGWLEPDAIPDFLADCDVFLHPARFEPYGVAVLEAMACGKVVLGSDATAAVLDRIQSGENGFIHRSDDLEDLTIQIRRVLDQQENWLTIGRAARATAEEWPVSRAVEIIRAIMMKRI